MSIKHQIDKEVADLAKRYAPIAKDLGDKPSIAIAQSALETGWWTSRLWKEGKGAFGMQSPRSPVNRKLQTGPSVMLGGVPHAGYVTAEDAFIHRLHWLRQDARSRPGLTLMQRLDTKWAPPDPKYPSNEGYSSKVMKIVRDYGLEEYDR